MSYVKALCVVVACLACLEGHQGTGHAEVQAESSLVDLINRCPCTPKGLEEYCSLWKHNTIVCFGAKWCGYCPAQKKIVRALEKQGYTVEIFDVDEHPKIYAHLKGKTESIPLTVIFVNGKVKERFVGVTSAKKIKEAAKECKINVSTS